MRKMSQKQALINYREFCRAAMDKPDASDPECILWLHVILKDGRIIRKLREITKYATDFIKDNVESVQALPVARPKLTPVNKKLFEPEGNLKGRAKWFQSLATGQAKHDIRPKIVKRRAKAKK